MKSNQKEILESFDLNQIELAYSKNLKPLAEIKEKFFRPVDDQKAPIKNYNPPIHDPPKDVKIMKSSVSVKCPSTVQNINSNLNSIQMSNLALTSAQKPLQQNHPIQSIPEDDDDNFCLLNDSDPVINNLISQYTTEAPDAQTVKQITNTNWQQKSNNVKNFQGNNNSNQQTNNYQSHNKEADYYNKSLEVRRAPYENNGYPNSNYNNTNSHSGQFSHRNNFDRTNSNNLSSSRDFNNYNNIPQNSFHNVPQNGFNYGYGRVGNNNFSNNNFENNTYQKYNQQNYGQEHYNPPNYNQPINITNTYHNNHNSIYICKPPNNNVVSINEQEDELDFDPSLLQEIFDKEEEVKEHGRGGSNNAHYLEAQESADGATFVEKFCTNHRVANLSEWQGPYEWEEAIREANLKVFGYRNFRPNQREIINASLKGRDIFVCMPTGGGKSLTFQIPAIISPGVTIIVMPLLSLIQDQVSILEGLGIKCAFLNAKSEREIFDNFDEFFLNSDEENRCKMLFVTPEKISKSARTSNLFDNLYNQGLIERFVIDEAHCVSQWGREFRPDYLHLRVLKQNYPSIPILAVTATAPNKVREDIITQLRMQNALFFRASYNRTNLYIEVRNKRDVGDEIQNMAEFIKRKYPNDCGLIYCLSKKQCEEVAQKLKKEYKLSTAYYHAGLPENVKNEVQDKWKNDEIKIIVATVAFGMGINKADVRYVFHHAMPKSFENYYQEIGRAGRDGKKSYCILYYNSQDRKTQEYLMAMQKMNNTTVTQNLRKLTELADYCEETTVCRRIMALLYFDEKFKQEDCNRMCDNCRRNISHEEVDMTEVCLKILKLADTCRIKSCFFTMTQTVDFLRGMKLKNKNLKVNDKDPSFGSLKSVTSENLKKVLRRMSIIKLLDEYLTTYADKSFAQVTISREGQDVLLGRKKIELKILVAKKGINASEPIEVAGTGKKKSWMAKDIEDGKSDDAYANVKTSDLIKMTGEEIKKRKYTRRSVTDMDPVEYNENKVELEEDYGFCLKDQFDELLDKLKIKRREILNEENQKLEKLNMSYDKISKLTGDDIFPINGLKDLCRKLPLTKEELNTGFIFGVSAKNLANYGKEFLPIIIKHQEVYNIQRDNTEYDKEVLKSMLNESVRKSGKFAVNKGANSGAKVKPFTKDTEKLKRSSDKNKLVDEELNESAMRNSMGGSVSTLR